MVNILPIGNSLDFERHCVKWPHCLLSSVHTIVIRQDEMCGAKVQAGRNDKRWQQFVWKKLRVKCVVVPSANHPIKFPYICQAVGAAQSGLEL
jgi:hypothetical protein